MTNGGLSLLVKH